MKNQGAPKPPTVKPNKGNAPDDFIHRCVTCNCRLDGDRSWRAGRYTYVQKDGQWVPQGLCFAHSGETPLGLD